MSVKSNSKESSRKPKQITKKPLEKPEETEDDVNIDPEEMWRKFELELKWCVDQLEAQLSSKKSTPRQTMEAAKTLKVLINPKAHLIRKRQLMRTTFGDYRQKMKQDELKFDKEIKKITVSAVRPSHQKGTFLKRSVTSNTHESSLSVSDEVSRPVFSFKKSDGNFKFNFLVENSDSPA